MAYLTLFCRKFLKNSRKKSQRSGRGAGVKPVGPNSQLLPKICFASFPQADYEIWKFHVNFGQFAGERCQQIFKISTSHTCPCQSSYQMAGWSAKAHFVNCQSCRDYSFSNYWTAQDVVNMRKELFFVLQVNIGESLCNLKFSGLSKMIRTRFVKCSAISPRVDF